MNNLDQAILKAATAMLQKFNNRLNKTQRENEATLSDWASYLAIEKGYKVSQIGFALGELMKKSPTFMPSAYEIEGQLIPKEESVADSAPVIANELLEFFRLHHYDLEEKYLSTLTTEARAVFELIGDSRVYRNSENPETAKAQLERYIKGLLAQKKNRAVNQRLESIGIDVPGRVLEFPKPEMQTMDYSNFLPEVNS